MDLKYYDDNNSKWVSLKTVCGVEGVADTATDDDSAFATPKYVTSKIITKDGNLVKYLNEIILNKEIALGGKNITKNGFVSNIELKDENGTVTLTPTYGEIADDEKGNFVSDVSFENGNLKIARTNISSDILNPISSGSDIPDSNTAGFFYLQIEESNNSEASA
jgi:hypothetical protein